MAKVLRVSELLTISETMSDAKEMLDWAAKNGIALTNEKARMYIAETHSPALQGELSDEALAGVAGGIVTKCKSGRCFIP